MDLMEGAGRFLVSTAPPSWAQTAIGEAQGVAPASMADPSVPAWASVYSSEVDVMATPKIADVPSFTTLASGAAFPSSAA